jgi:predicted phosphodiesterase
MRIAIVSDLHANIEALKSFPEDFDELWVLGDLVSYGPDPAEADYQVRKRATLVVPGNHDHAVGAGADPRCSEAFHALATATLAFTNKTLASEAKTYLANVPFTAERTVDGVRLFRCHAVPSEPLFTSCRQDSPRWREEVAN